MKQKALLLPAALLSAAMLVGCGEYKAQLNANWYKDTSITNAISGTYEKLTYAVAFLDNASNDAYSVRYEPGTYTVELIKDIYTWEDGSKEEVYRLTSRLEISGAYRYEGTEYPFADQIDSVCYFRPVSDALAPIRSEKSIHSTTPAAPSPQDAEQVFRTYAYTTLVQYAKDGTSMTATIDTGAESGPREQTYELDTGYSYFDNEQLLFAGRAFAFAAQSSVQVNSLGVEAGKIQDILYSCTATDKRTQTINGEEKKDIDVNVVTFSVQDRMGGASQSLWYAAKTAGANTYRNALLYMEVPLNYNLGTLTYTLTEAEWTTM